MLVKTRKIRYGQIDPLHSYVQCCRQTDNRGRQSAGRRASVKREATHVMKYSLAGTSNQLIASNHQETLHTEPKIQSALDEVLA